MPVAVSGVTTIFTLNAATATQLANANNGRSYVLIVNNDQTNTVWIGFGTNNAAAVNMIPIPPSAPNAPSYYESTSNAVKGDISAIAGAGAPVISYTEA